ncbi:alpha-N-arabinofuranosidase [Paenibacillus ferrarius]|uniref:arabinosylfuranosidase ArfA n=1 Tax=Paenibacillus ferrarius TaxID=1469647 RepID=UPI003D2CE16F
MVLAIQKGKAVIDRDYIISRIDPRIYGGFIEHMGRCVYEGIYDPQHAEADEQGFRQDVLAMVQDLQVPIIRYPGGNFVSGFRWEDSVGPKEERPVRMDAAWKSIEPNEVGLGEFDGWAARAGSDVMMAVNLGTRGVEAAAQLLEYCNVGGGTAMSELRKRHGRQAPYGYKVWCLGNEMDGPWQICNKSAEDYGTLARETGKVMKRIDPSIELVACGSSGIHLPTFPQWDATVMDLCYEYADYLSVHMYLDNKEEDLDNYLLKAVNMDRYIDAITATCDYVKAKKRSDKVMYLSFDEWNVVPGTWKKNDVAPWIHAPALCEGNYSMADALVFGNMLISLLKHSDRVRIACLAQLVNVFGPIMTDRAGTAWKQCVYYPYLHASLYGRGIALNVMAEGPVTSTRDFSDVPLLDAVAVLDEASGDITVFAVNRSANDTLEIALELRGFGDYARCERIVMQHEDGGAFNSAAQPNVIVPQQLSTERVDGGRYTASFAPMSWNVLRLKQV